MTFAAAELASLAAKLPPSDRLELVETILATARQARSGNSRGLGEGGA